MNSKIFLACAALLFGITTATAAVESDIVGYTNIECKSGLSLLSSTFESLGSAEAVNIQDFIQGVFEEGDSLMFYKQGGGYDTYVYFSELYDEDWNSIGKPGWGNMDGQIVNREIKPGDAFWVNVKTAKTLTLKGVVKATAQSIDCGKGLNLVASAFPKALDANKDLIFSGITEGDSLMIYKQGGGYDTYVYFSELYDENWESTGKSGWGNMDGQAVDVAIPANTAFWVVAQNPLTKVIQSPIQ